MVIGAGHVGRTVVEALHDEHDVTVIDLDAANVAALSYRFDVHAVTGNGASRRTLGEARIDKADLVIASTSRDEVNLVATMLAKRMSSARTVVRTSNAEYLDAWREREIDVDFMVSPEVETANAVASIVGIPAARQTDVFADGRVQIVEFDVPEDSACVPIVGRKLRDAAVPEDSKVVGMIRGSRAIRPDGDAVIEPGDRIIVISSPEAARAWSRALALAEHTVDDVVIFGAGKVGTALARVLLERSIRVRIVEQDGTRARAVAEALPRAEVFESDGLDPEFLERERIGQASATVFAMKDDAKTLYAAVLARLHGVELTIAIVNDPASTGVLEKGGVDVAINPRDRVAEELVRFAHDPRILQLAMLEHDRFEVLDLAVREDSELAGRPFRELPETGTIIGAVIRDGRAMFPNSDDVLHAGDRVIVFVESSRATHVEKVL